MQPFDGLLIAVAHYRGPTRRACLHDHRALDSGYWELYTDTVLQADEGADLDFLRGKRSAVVPRDNH